MPTVPIPLVLPSTARGWAKSIGTSAKDQQLINGVYEASTSGISEAGGAVYVSKRAASTEAVITAMTTPQVLTHYSSIVTNPLLVNGTQLQSIASVDYGNVGGPLPTTDNLVLADMISGEKGIVAFVGGSSAGYFLYSDAYSTNFPTFSGDTHTNTVIDNIASTTGLYPGQAITGSGIQAGTRIATITSSTAITTTLATTATAAGVTITKEAVAKIISANFPSAVVSCEALNGRFFWATSTGRIYQSALNDPATYDADEYISADYAGDNLVCIFKNGEYIGASGTLSTIQYFSYGQNSFGSVLVKGPIKTGIRLLSKPIDVGGVKYVRAATTNPVAAGNSGGFYAMDLLSFERISDDILSSYLGTNSRMIVISNGSKTYLAMVVSTSATFPVYDISTGQFSEFSLATALRSGNGRYYTMASNTGLFLWETGNTWTDAADTNVMTLQTKRHILNNGMGFTINWIDLIADTESTGTATLGISVDDYANWVPVGSFDMTQTTKRVFVGMYVGSMPAFRVQHSANTNLRASQLMVNFTPATT